MGGKKPISLYISRVVNYSYEFHFDQNRFCPNWTTALMLCTRPCLLGCIRWCSVPKLSVVTSPASPRSGSTHLSADSHRWAQAAHPAWPGRLPTPVTSLCVQPKAPPARRVWTTPLNDSPGNIPGFDLWWFVGQQPDKDTCQLSKLVP